MRNLLLCTLTMLLVLDVYAQDPRFSQYNASPLNLNPAMTGAFNGNYRLSAIYRSQWQSILSADDPQGTTQFRTLSAGLDMRFKIGDRRSHDAVGVGLSFLSDKAGAANFGSNGLSFSFSYSKAFDKQGYHKLAGGFQAGFMQRGIDYTNLRFGAQFNNASGEFDPSFGPQEAQGDDNFLFYDLGLGVFWYLGNPKNKGRTNYYAGVALAHLNRPNQSFYEFSVDSINTDLPMKLTVHGGVQFPIATQVDILPSFMLLNQGPAVELNFGALAKIFFVSNEPHGNAFYVGPYYRIVGRDNVTDDGGISSEALILVTRLDIQNFIFGFSYDLNFSELTDASNTRGGFEVSVNYIGSWDNKPRGTFCPKF